MEGVTMGSPTPEFSVFIYCDNAAHTNRVAVTNFDVRRGAWSERVASRSRTSPSSGETLVGNTLPQAGWALDPAVSNSDIRSHFDVRCRKCEGRKVAGRVNVSARPAVLYGVLDALRDAGITELPLAVLAASITRSRNL